MVVALELLEEFPWVLSLAVFSSLLIAVAACVCRRRKKETLEFGLPTLSSSNQNCTILITQSLDKEKRTSLVYGSSEQIPGDVRTRPSSVNRALPDIPVSSVPHQSSLSDTDTDLELYAAVNNVNKPSEAKNKLKNHRPNKPRAPQPPRPHGSQLTDYSETSSGSNKYQMIGANQVSPKVANRNGSLHPGELVALRSTSNHYDQPSGDVDANGDHEGLNITPVHGKISNKLYMVTSNHSNMSDGDTYEPPPVPEKRFDIDEEPNRGNADSDWRPGPSVLPGGDLPHTSDGGLLAMDRSHVMTASIHVMQTVDNNRELEMQEGSEVPYTVISVREPLAKVREQTFQQMKRRLPHQQSSSSQEGESHYMEVEEQTYAEIDSAHNSGRGSSMYDRIEPSERDLPPAPPTVESLMTVAHVHSRQASSASAATSLSSRSSSPRAVSPTAPNQSKDLSGLYSVVNKSGKQRQTIHVAEGASLLPAHAEPQAAGVEDLYAKVRKNRGSASGNPYGEPTPRNSREIDEVFYPPSCSTSMPPEPPPIAGRIRATSLYDPAARSTNKQLDHRLSANMDAQHQDPSAQQEWLDDNEPGYERVTQDHSYEKVACDSDDPGYEIIQRRQLPDVATDSDYEQIRSSCIKEYEASDPGYEQVQEMSRIENDALDPGYESVAGVVREDSDMDPDYEQISRVCQNSESDNDTADPGYECVHIDGQDESLEPGYDRVRLERQGLDSDSGDSDYETVCRVTRSDSEGYERIKGIRRTESDATEPGYEKVRVPLLSSTPGFNDLDHRDDESLDPGYELVGPSSPLILKQTANHHAGDSAMFAAETLQENILVQQQLQPNGGEQSEKYESMTDPEGIGKSPSVKGTVKSDSEKEMVWMNGYEENSVISGKNHEDCVSTKVPKCATSTNNDAGIAGKGDAEQENEVVTAGEQEIKLLQDQEVPRQPLTVYLQRDFVRDIEDTSL